MGVEDNFAIARLAASGIADAKVANHFGISVSSVKTAMSRLNLALSLRVNSRNNPLPLSEKNKSEYASDTVDRLQQMSNKFNLVKEILANGSLPLAKDIIRQPHLHHFLEYFCRGHNLREIAGMYDIDTDKHIEEKISKSMIDNIVYGLNKKVLLHTFLQKMVFSRFMKGSSRWSGEYVEENQYQSTLNRVVEGRGGAYINTLRRYLYLRELINDKPDIFFEEYPEMQKARSFSYGELSPATQYFIGGHFLGVSGKQLGAPLVKITGYSGKTIQSTISSGVRFTENMLLSRSNHPSHKSLSRSRQTEIKDIFISLRSISRDEP